MSIFSSQSPKKTPEIIEEVHSTTSLKLNSSTAFVNNPLFETAVARRVRSCISYSTPFSSWSLFAIFDGPLAGELTNFAADNLFPYILATKEFKILRQKIVDLSEKEIDSYIEFALSSAFSSLNEKIAEFSHALKFRGQSFRGFNALCALITPERIFIASLGNSRALLSSRDNRPLSPSSSSRGLSNSQFEFYKFNRSGQESFLVLASESACSSSLANQQICELISSSLKKVNNKATSIKGIASRALECCFPKEKPDNVILLLVTFPSPFVAIPASTLLQPQFEVNPPLPTSGDLNANGSYYPAGASSPSSPVNQPDSEPNKEQETAKEKSSFA